MMPDRSYSATAVVSGLCWISGFVLVVLYMWLDVRTAQLGLLIAGVGGVLTMRSYLLQLERRERNAFEIGREWAGVEPLRRR